jgi:aromatic ring-cleaving dioxygenase
MAEASADPSVVEGYHAHLYYAPETRPIAERLRTAIAEHFPRARIGNWHDEPVGPHSVAMYQVAFATGDFPSLVPWLMLNREDLSILVHPLTGDSVADHTRFALWLGSPVPLRVEVLRRGRQPS